MFHIGNPIAVFVFLLVLAIFLTVKGRGRIQNFGVAGTSILAVLSLCEVAATIWEPPHPSRTIADLNKSGGKLIDHRPVVGWGPTAPGRYESRQFLDGKLIYDATYTIGSDLLRKVDSGSDGKGVAFLGDSVIFGEGIQDGDTLPQQFADLEGRASPVYNLGFSAYSPAQALAEMRAGLYDKDLSNSRLIVEFVAPWHADRVSCKVSWVEGAPRFLSINGRIVQTGTCQPTASPLSYFAMFRLFRPPTMTTVTDRDVALLTAITEQVIRLAREKYHVPIVIFYKREPAYLSPVRGWTDDKIMQVLRDAGAEVLEYVVPPGAQYRIAGDGHPTRLTNTLCARKLYDFVREQFPDIETTAAR